tara:strand:+ start:268 stop:498 length:231 start_codon:yes stop_codon:yes gene_type:complete
MKQEKIRETIKQLVAENLQWCDPYSEISISQVKRHPEKCPEGSTFQSAEEALDDIIFDLTNLSKKLTINSDLNDKN